MSQTARFNNRYHYAWSLAVVTALMFVASNAGARAVRAQGAGKKVITHELIWLMKRVGAPLPSPDGRWVVFPVIEPSYDDKDQISDLWITAADGSTTPRRLTFSKGVEGGVAWSPDSRRLAFSAKREGDEVNQIYVIEVVAGGEAMRATS